MNQVSPRLPRADLKRTTHFEPRKHFKNGQRCNNVIRQVHVAQDTRRMCGERQDGHTRQLVVGHVQRFQIVLGEKHVGQHSNFVVRKIDNPKFGESLEQITVVRQVHQTVV